MRLHNLRQHALFALAALPLLILPVALADEADTPETKNIDKALDLIARKLIPSVHGHSVNVAAFTIDGGGKDLSLSEKLKSRLKGDVKGFQNTRADLTVVGTASELLDGNQKPVGVQLIAEVKKNGRTLAEGTAQTSDLNAIPIASSGVFAAPPTESPQSGADQSAVSVDQNGIAPNASYPYRVLLVDARTGQPIPVKAVSKDTCHATMPKGTEYLIRLFNDSEYAAAADVSIDGLNRFALYRDNMSLARYLDVIEKRGHRDIQGWARDDTTDLIFTVVDVEQAVLRLDAKGIKGEVGVIKVTFRAAWEKNGTVPPGEPSSELVSVVGTGAGTPISAAKQFVSNLNVGRPRATITISYDSP